MTTGSEARLRKQKKQTNKNMKEASGYHNNEYFNI